MREKNWLPYQGYYWPATSLASGTKLGATDEWGEVPVTKRAAPLWLQVSYKLLAAGFRGGTF